MDLFKIIEDVRDLVVKGPGEIPKDKKGIRKLRVISVKHSEKLLFIEVEVYGVPLSYRLIESLKAVKEDGHVVTCGYLPESAMEEENYSVERRKYFDNLYPGCMETTEKTDFH